MSDFRKLLDIVAEMSDESPIQLHDSVDLELNDDFVIETGVVGFLDDGIVLEADEQTLEFLNVNSIIVESQDLSERMVMGVANEPSESVELDETGMVFGMGQAYNEESKPGLWANIHAKRKRIKAGSGERMRKPGSKGAPSAQDFKDAAKTSKNESLDEGQMKDMMMADAERMELEQFLDRWAKRPEDTEWCTEFWKTTNDEVDEAKYQGREVPLGKPMKGDVKKSKVYVRKPNGKVVKVNFGDKNMRIKKSNPNRRKSFRARHRCENPGPRWKARYWSCRAW